MKPKAVGLLVAGGLIVSALGVYLIGNVKVTPKQKVPQQTQVEVQVKETQQPVQQQQVTQQVVQQEQQPVQQMQGQQAIQQEQPVQQQQVTQQAVQQQAVQQEQQPVNTTAQQNSTGNTQTGTHDKVLKLITAEGKLDYSSIEQTTTGEVKGKKSYLLNNQIVYCIEIAVAMGTDTKAVDYFCMHDTYAKVSEGSRLTVKYQQTTTNTFSVSSVSLQ